MEESWVQDLLRQCKEQRVRFFFKQWGASTRKLLDVNSTDEPMMNYPSCNKIRSREAKNISKFACQAPKPPNSLSGKNIHLA
jgi:hypothetical protein